MRVVLGADASTTAVKVVAWDERGEAVAEGRAPLSLSNPGPAAWEQDATTFRAAFGEAARACLAKVSGPVEALAVTHQRETFVLTDGAGEPKRPAVTWMDGRGVEEVLRASTHFGREHLRERTGKEPCITPSFYKLAAAYARDPDARALELNDVGGLFLRWLTGRRATSLGSADPLGLVDMRAGSFDPDLVRWLGLDLASLPELVAPGAVVGRVTSDAAAWSGLPGGLPVVAALGDGQCAGLGAGLTGPGVAYLNLGTALVGGALSDTYVTSRAFRTLYAGAPGTWFLETDLKGGMFSVGWWVERMLGRPLEPLLDEAARVPPGSDGLLFLPHLLGVMNPHWNDDARGALVGLAAHHGPGHVLRAILEGLAMEQWVHFDGVERATGRLRRIVLLGGGAKSDILVAALSDVFDTELVHASTTEATALGAGILAACGAGWFADVPTAVTAMTRPGPAVPRGDRGRLALARYETLYTRLAAADAAG